MLHTYSYTQDFNSNHNTHLVAKTAQGAKYEAAVKLMNSSSRSIVIVGSVWLKECQEQHAWMDPPLAHHHHFAMEDATIKKRTTATTGSREAADPDILIRSLKELLAEGDDTAAATASAVGAPTQLSSLLLFLDCQFLLIGFPLEERNLLTRLVVGRGCGTIYWELVDTITHVIVQDDAGDAMLR
jgi:hypothetical protein